MAIEFHESPYSPDCKAVKVLAKLIGVELKSVLVKVEEGEHRKPEFTQLNPFQSIPVIIDDGLKLFQSRAILTYLLNKYAPENELYPKDPQSRARVDAILALDAGSLDPFYKYRIRAFYKSGKDIGEEGQAHLKNILTSLNTFLSKQKYAAGDKLTVADISLVHTLTFADIFGDDLSEYGHVFKYYKQVQEELGAVFHDINDESIKASRAFAESKRQQ